MAGRALVVGLANDQSIGWGIAQALAQAGWELMLTCQPGRSEAFVRPLADSLGAGLACLDVRDAQQEAALFARVEAEWGRLDALVHAVAFAPREDLHGRVVDCSAEGFALAMDISVHSFVRLVRRAEALMHGGGLCLTVSFQGAQRVVSTYNLMGPVKAALEAVVRELASELGGRGIRVNAISPGPMPTRAAGGIADFDAMLEDAVRRAPLGRLATLEECGAAAAFLAGPGGAAITGVVLPIDAGLAIVA